jgi:putative toxin-antitoxin system antitoxin component (TIGR02293 family)
MTLAIQTVQQSKHTTPKKASKPSAKAAHGSSPPRRQAISYQGIYLLPGLERGALVKLGTPAAYVQSISADMGLSKQLVVSMLGLSPATVTRKIAAGTALSRDDSERMLGLAKLIGQVQTVVEESGQPEGFNAAKWFGTWIAQPVAALGGLRPQELLDTADGRETVSKLVAQMQSGAYA